MALQFTPPPQDLIDAYLNRPSPGQIASQSIGHALQTYAQGKATQQKQQDDAMKEYISAYGQGGPALANQVGSRMGLKNPPSFEPPTLSTGTTPSPQSNPMAATPVEQAAQSSLPAEHPAGVPDAAPPISPIIQASLASGHPNHGNIQLPSQEDPVALINQGAYGQKRLSALETAQKLTDAQTSAADKAQESGPKSFDYAKAFAKNAGALTAADDFISLAQKEGRSTLTKREMDDIKNSINVSAQQGRGQFYNTMGNVKEQQLRDSLIKEARTTLDPYFNTGAGKQQAVRLNNIGRAEALVNQMQSQQGGGDTRQMRELATSLGSVLTGGNVVAQNQIEELIPQTYKGNFNRFLEKLTNNPTGLEQQQFVKRFADTLSREKSTIQGQARSVAERSAPTLRVLKSQYPEDYNAVVDQYMKNSPELMGPTPGATTEVPTISDDAAFKALPSGSSFKDPSGQVHRKK